MADFGHGRGILDSENASWRGVFLDYSRTRKGS